MIILGLHGQENEQLVSANRIRFWIHSFTSTLRTQIVLAFKRGGGFLQGDQQFRDVLIPTRATLMIMSNDSKHVCTLRKRDAPSCYPRYENSVWGWDL